MHTVTAEQSGELWAKGRPGWVSLEGEGALARSPGLVGVSGSVLGLLGHSGPRTPRGCPW